MRFCIDYRALNSVTVRDVYPLPRIEDSLAALQKGLYFITLDLFLGYWQIPMDKSFKEKTSFATYSILYKFNEMAFGLTNAPISFQRFIDATLAELKWSSLLVYIDDIVVFLPSFEQHFLDLREVLVRLRTASFQLKPSKCHFYQCKLTYLGHVVL